MTTASKNFQGRQTRPRSGADAARFQHEIERAVRVSSYLSPRSHASRSLRIAPHDAGTVHHNTPYSAEYVA